jgi:protein-S-isoprenylcysteine O-methyltransferase Ste14
MVQRLLWPASVAICLFVPAGTVLWPGAWLFLVSFVGGTLATMGWLKHHDPALFAERTQVLGRPGQPLWDKAIAIVIAIVWYGWLIAMGFGVRVAHGAATPVWVLVAGVVFIAVGFFFAAWCFKTNTFAATAVRLQPERAQAVITSGPYAWVRHPVYAASLLVHLGTLFLLGIRSGFWGLPLLALIVARRAVLEERTLRQGLAGYGEYAARVRWRLIPGLW